MAKIDVSALLNSHRSVFSPFTDAFVLLVILGYETVCFILAVLGVVFLAEFVAEFFQENVHQSLGGPSATQAMMALCMIPFAVKIILFFEDFIIRPAINRAKHQFSFFLRPLPQVLDFLKAILAFIIIYQEFHKRFYIFIEKNELPRVCIVTGLKYATRKVLPTRLLEYCEIERSESDLYQEAENTSRYSFAIMYLTYFLAQKIHKDGFMEGSSRIITWQLSIDAVLGSITFFIPSSMDYIRNEKNFYDFSDAITFIFIFFLAFLSEYISYSISYPTAELVTNEAGDEGRNTCSRKGSNGKTIFTNENSLSWIHQLLFIMASMALFAIFFSIEYTEDVDLEMGEEEKLEMGLVAATRWRKSQELVLEEREAAIRTKVFMFKATFGYQILMFGKTLSANFFKYYQV